MPVLEVRHLKKSFGTVSAVEDISFSVEPGEVYHYRAERCRQDNHARND
jgi:ABC-type multidrug transport system ATPase subunit